MLTKKMQGKRMFIVLAGFIAALLGVGLASADIRGDMADTMGDYYQARAGMAPVGAEVEHPIPAVAPQPGDMEVDDPAAEEVEAKLEDDPEDEAEEAVEGAEGDQDDGTPAETDDADTDDDTDNKTSIPLPGGSDDTEADDDTDGAADAAADEDSADTEEQDD